MAIKNAIKPMSTEISKTRNKLGMKMCLRGMTEDRDHNYDIRNLSQQADSIFVHYQMRK